MLDDVLLQQKRRLVQHLNADFPVHPQNRSVDEEAIATAHGNFQSRIRFHLSLPALSGNANHHVR